MSVIQRDNRLLLPEGPATWGRLAEELTRRLGAASGFAGGRVVFVLDTMPDAFAAIAYGVTGNLDFGVIEQGRLSPEVVTRFLENGVTLVALADGAVIADPAHVRARAPDSPPGSPGEKFSEPLAGTVASTREAGSLAPSPAVVPGRITVLTSGTTGLLKLIPHSAESLNTFDRVSGMGPNGWFVPYQIGSYAWYQMVALGLFVPGQDLIPGDFTDLAASFETALKADQVTAISSTPTFWRHALMSIDQDLLTEARLTSISMGGEIVDQAILDRLAGLYPTARIRHIYASSEAGAAIVVTDGRAGFDAKILARDTGPIAVKVDAGRLFIRSRYGNAAETGAWIDTGDLVEEREGRVYFLGRADNTMINVGGQKAFPPDIEAHLLRHPQVVWAQVKARRAPMVGHLPVAAVVLREKMAEAEAEDMLIAHCTGHLADYAIPRLWDFPDHVPLRASLKS